MAKPTPKRRKKSTTRRRASKVTKPRRVISKAAARETRHGLKHKPGKATRRVAKKLGKVVRKQFTSGLTTPIVKGYKAVREVARVPRTVEEKEKRLAAIGIKPYKGERKRTKKQRKKIEELYADFAEFTARGAFKAKQKFRIIRTANKETLNKARKSGMAVYEHSIYVHVASEKETAKLGRFMGEKIIARTYYGKLERVFLGGADVFHRVVGKLQRKPLAPGQMITGAFFGGPTFHRAIYNNVGEFLNYINNAFVPHLPAGQKPSKRNIARAKASLIKNLAVVQIENPEFESDEE